MAIFIGNSHLAAIERGYKETTNGIEQHVGEVVFLQMDGSHVPPFKRSNDGIALNPAVHDLLCTNLKQTNLIVSAIGGNGHNILGLVNMSPPVDFYDPEDPTFSSDHMIIPRQLMKAALRRRIEDWLRLMNEVRKRTIGIKMLHVSPPPPIRDHEYILNNPGPFREQFETNGISVASVRLKLWRLHIELLEESCRENNIVFIQPPAVCLTDDGFLSPECYGGDPSHANALYGRMVIQSILGAAQNAPV